MNPPRPGGSGAVGGRASDIPLAVHAGTPVVVLSDAAWRRDLGRDPGVIGRTLQIDRQGG
jgi:hypothetical protein